VTGLIAKPGLQLVLVLLVAPLLGGIIKTLKARLQTRRGPNILQSYRDIFKLFRKGMVIPETASWIFSATPYVVFVTAALVGLMIPMITTDAPLSLFGGVLAVVLLKAGTIEAQQPAGGADPEISVRGLGKRLHNLLRQALLRRPHSLGIGSWRRLSGASGSKLKDRNNDKGDKQGGSDGGAREGESSFVVAPVHRVQHGMLTTQSKSEPREPSAGSRTPRIYHTSRTA